MPMRSARTSTLTPPIPALASSASPASIHRPDPPSSPMSTLAGRTAYRDTAPYLNGLTEPQHQTQGPAEGRTRRTRTMDLLLTYRGAVYPWHCDQNGHMNVMWYVGKFDEATWSLMARIGVTRSYLRDAGRG